MWFVHFVLILTLIGTSAWPADKNKKSEPSKLTAREKEIVRRAKREFVRAKRSKAPGKNLKDKMQSGVE